MSLSASGSFGGAMVFSHSKGRNIVRQLVIPSNPRTEAQVAVRNKLAVGAAVQNVVNYTALKHPALPFKDEIMLRNIAPTGVTWNALVTKLIVGIGGANYAAATAAYAGVVVADWNTAALGLAKPYAAISRPNPTGTGYITVSPGEQFFRHVYALFSGGLLTVAPTIPPVYA